MTEGLLGTKLVEWPYPIRYREEKEVSSDILVLGGGIAGCWAAISAAKKGASVAIVEQGATKRSGAGGTGVDHWNFAADNPCSGISPDELATGIISASGGYGNGITDYILCSTSYETLLELEEMGGKIRDTEDEFKGAEFRDEKTKLLFAIDYEGRINIRVWGSTFKPALQKECKRLGVKIYDRVMATSLLTDGGKQGGRVVGATGINVRTGEFNIFKAKSTILCMSSASRNWTFSTELRGITQAQPIQNVGNGHAMAWRAGAELTMMERSGSLDSVYIYPLFGTGNPSNTWYACTMVDANGKEIPWVDRDGKILKTEAERHKRVPGQKCFLMTPPPGKDADMFRGPRIIPDLKERIQKGEFVLPLYADLPGMPEHERRAIWGFMVGEEGKSKVPILKTYLEAGFDPEKDLLQSYIMLRGDPTDRQGLPQDRILFGGGVVVDWDLKATLEGLYAAGSQAFANRGHAGAATSGRWAGKKAADSALKAGEPVIDRGQIDNEKDRVYGPLANEDGVDWKELSAALCRIMQNYCGEPKNDELLNIGLKTLNEIKEEEMLMLYADNPHKLVRALDVMDILTCDEMITHACLARKASSRKLGFIRTDYPEMDPPEWRKWITIKQEDGNVKIGEMPLDFYEPLKENYEAHKDE